MGIVKAYQYGCRNSYEVADYLGVTEEFLADALKAYKSKYGICATVDNYIVYFEPYVGIMEIKQIKPLRRFNKNTMKKEGRNL